MKKVVFASLLAVACSAPFAFSMKAQPQNGIQMQPDEYKVYSDCSNATTPADKATKCEAYLKQYPNSAVKADVLEQLMFADSAIDPVKTLDAADRTLAANPNDLFAYVFEAQLRRSAADALTDPAAKQAGYDSAAGYARKALDLGKPAGMDDPTFAKIKTGGYPVLYGAIAVDDLGKKDNAGAIKTYKEELASAPPESLTQPSQQLQDMVGLAQAYYTSTPPDLLNCAWYATRAAAFAQTFAAQIQPLANYCYKKYHGDLTGYDKLQAAVQTSVNPPDGFLATFTPAPKPEDIVAQTIASTPDLATLAISDKEFILQYGKPADADKVFATVKGKSTQFPAVMILDGSTADILLVAVTDDSQASKTADFSFKMKEPLKTIPATGTKVDIEGTYDSYTQSPLLITMIDGAVVEPKKPAQTHRAPVHHR